MKIAKRRMLISLILSTILVTIVFAIPSRTQEIFLSRNLVRQILDVVVNLTIFLIIFYAIGSLAAWILKVFKFK